VSGGDIDAAEAWALHILERSKPRAQTHMGLACRHILALVAEVRRARRLVVPPREVRTAYERWEAAGAPGTFGEWAASREREQP